jgi:hypothetical protein
MLVTLFGWNVCWYDVTLLRSWTSRDPWVLHTSYNFILCYFSFFIVSFKNKQTPNGELITTKINLSVVYLCSVLLGKRKIDTIIKNKSMSWKLRNFSASQETLICYTNHMDSKEHATSWMVSTFTHILQETFKYRHRFNSCNFPVDFPTNTAQVLSLVP